MFKRIFFSCLLTASMANAETNFVLESPDIQQGKLLAATHVYSGCGGGNLSPALVWKNPPVGTKSFAITVYDPDAPTGSGWWHWVVFNIPATESKISRAAGTSGYTPLPPASIQSRTDFGVPGYGGACPPAGDKLHRYQFNVYALDVEKLPLAEDVSPAMVGFNMHSHILAHAQIEALYQH